MKKVYICHPFKNNPSQNIQSVRKIAIDLIDFSKDRTLPIAPHLYLPQLVDDETQRNKAMEMCLELLGVCDEVHVFGDNITEGMKIELEYAEKNNIPIVFVEYTIPNAEEKAVSSFLKCWVELMQGNKQ